MKTITARFSAALGVMTMVTLLACSGDEKESVPPAKDITVLPDAGAASGDLYAGSFDQGNQPPPDQGAMPPADKGTTPPPDRGTTPPADKGTTPPPDRGTPPPADKGTPPPPADQGPPEPDLGAPINITTPTQTRRVAAVQYGSGQAAAVKSACVNTEYPDVCALKELATRARRDNASLIILPEYAIDQKWYEPVPDVGTNPGTSAYWPNELIIKAMSYHARNLGAYIILVIHTYTGDSDANLKIFNTQIAFDTTGKVVAVHHKFNLFGGETSYMTAGTDWDAFDHPMGKVGLLICADIYGSHALLSQLSYAQPAMVAVSSYWTVNGASSWYSSYANDYNVYAAIANHTHGTGSGGGFWAPNGVAIVEKIATTPHIMIETIP